MAPPNYEQWLPRVSQIVEFKFPFEGNAKMRFQDWLMSNDIREDDYMKEASEWGTYVHKSLEDYMDGIPFTWRKYSKIVKAWIKFIEDTWIKKLSTEHYIKTSRYQWTIDLVAEYWEEVWILDWKTFWLAKHKFWLPIPKYKKPYDKLKKARIQLSLYARAMGIKNIWVVELEVDGYHFHPLELVPDDELDLILKEYEEYTNWQSRN